MKVKDLILELQKVDDDVDVVIGLHGFEKVHIIKDIEFDEDNQYFIINFGADFKRI